MSVGERITAIMARDGIDRKAAIREFWNECNELIRPCILGTPRLLDLVAEEMRKCIEEFRDNDRSMFPEALASQAIACVRRYGSPEYRKAVRDWAEVSGLLPRITDNERRS